MAGIANGYSNLNSGQATMTGEAIQLEDFPASEVVLSAHENNLMSIFVGPSGVSESSGLEILPGMIVTLHVGRTAMIWAIGNSGDKLSFAAAF